MRVIKICGITNVQDALVAVQAGADLLGFILHPASPRYTPPAEIVRIISAVKQANRPYDQANGVPAHMSARFVGVFVNVDSHKIKEVLAQTGLDYAQLHGDEPPEALARLQGRGFKAIRPQTLDEALRLAEIFSPLGVADGPALLMDAYHPAAYGGVGQRADWSIAAQVAQRVPRLLLAGGLNAANVAEALASVDPWGVDVSSGVEAAPGRKDHQEVRRFIVNSRCAVH